MNETEFLKAIEAEPDNPVPRLVYADWLDEQGDLRGELLRIQEELRRIEVPDRAAKESRMHELLNDGVEPLVITQSNSVGMPMVLIFPGEFLMGSPEGEEGRLDNEDQVEVRLTQGFWLGKYTVTQAEWQQVMGTRPWEGDYMRQLGGCIEILREVDGTGMSVRSVIRVLGIHTTHRSSVGIRLPRWDHHLIQLWLQCFPT